MRRMECRCKEYVIRNRETEVCCDAFPSYRYSRGIGIEKSTNRMQEQKNYQKAIGIEYISDEKNVMQTVSHPGRDRSVCAISV